MQRLLLLVSLAFLCQWTTLSIALAKKIDPVPVHVAKNHGREETFECQPEYSSCYFQNCCDNLVCFTDGNQNNYHASASAKFKRSRIRSNSTCYSERSLDLHTKTDEEKLDLMRRFYEELVPYHSRKSTEQIERMVDHHRSSFPKLVARLEKRYKITFFSSSQLADTKMHEL
ncbi:expressed unknown protein [Seminavis robusta]|uniref:Uncharacterized protein n=1 Tax=Seminavis robusta TaxID=568900 RepID=A0A9N8E238_9STRA|nr:expressed unknown protein [Seminavis robusta]|eukprot:Sro467_g148910.1 n/a (172) ;mRNA; r:23265-23780